MWQHVCNMKYISYYRVLSRSEDSPKDTWQVRVLAVWKHSCAVWKHSCDATYTQEWDNQVQLQTIICAVSCRIFHTVQLIISLRVSSGCLGIQGADKSLARPRRKQANVSVRRAWISFGALPCRKKKNLMTACVLMLLKSRMSLTCFRACFLPGWAKDLSAPR